MMERTKVSRGDVTLSVLVTGKADGPTVLLSNSLGAGLEMWSPQRRLLEAKYRVIGYDTRGHGQSNTPAGAYSFDDLAADALSILDHFEVQSADFVGLSLGGMTSLGLGLMAPDRFDHIVCACARADAPPPFVASWDDRMAAIANGGVPAIWAGTLERWLTPDFAAANGPVIAALEKDFLATTPAGYGGCAAALKSLDYLQHLPNMTVPTMFIAGAEDMGASPAAMQAMADATPGSTYVEIPDCAHIANLNQVDAFNEALTDFLNL